MDDTPETNEAQFGTGRVSLSFARRLERERDDLKRLLNDAYVFLGLPHKALHPWRNSLDEWQKEVEKITEWRHFDEVEKSRMKK